MSRTKRLSPVYYGLFRHFRKRTYNKSGNQNVNTTLNIKCYYFHIAQCIKIMMFNKVPLSNITIIIINLKGKHVKYSDIVASCYVHEPFDLKLNLLCVALRADVIAATDYGLRVREFVCRVPFKIYTTNLNKNVLL